MTGGSLQAEILARLNESPDARCICFYGARETVQWQSRAQLYSKSVAVAQQLKQEGVRPGDVCIIVLPSGEKAVNTLLAILLLGAIPLLIAPPELLGGNLELHQTLHSAINRTKPRVVVCAPSIQPERIRMERSFPATRFVPPPEVENIESKNEPFTSALPASTDIAAMQLTSGTTREPRICVWDHKAVLAALEGMAAAMALSADDVCANWTPLYHDMGLVNNFFLCLARGVPLVLLSPQEFVRRPALWLRCLSQTGATVTWSPNFGFALAARKAQESELQDVRLDHVQAFWNAAERIHADTFDAFYSRFAPLGVKREALKTNFGCAENIGGATFSCANELPPREHLDRRLLDERGIAQVSSETKDEEQVVVVSAGVAHPALKIQILSPRGRVLPDGRVGEICLDTPSRMLRYYQNASETRRALRGGLLHTGDLGYLRNGHLFWVGRVRDRITIHGKKIDPSTFESIFASTPGLREGCFAAFGVPDEQLGTERLIMVAEVRSPVTESLKNLAATISRKCFLQLGITPGDIMLVPSGTLAKTSSGKRRHRHFRKLYLDGGLEHARMPLSDSMPAAAAAAQDLPESHLERVSKLPLK
jgi:fatty-acyl-CoA synthase